MGQVFRVVVFSYVVVWAVIEVRNAWRDFVRLRDTPIGVPPAIEIEG